MFRRSSTFAPLAPLISASVLLVSCTRSANSLPHGSASGAVAGRAAATSTIAIPGGEGGIGFDDLRFSKRLDRVLVPAGRTGSLALVDPSSRSVELVPGFGMAEGFAGGHGDGTTSVDEGDGFLFAIDRTLKRVDVVDPAERSIVSGEALAADPDYVRFVPGRRELWVTEPDAEQIEIFALSDSTPPAPRHVSAISVPGGPESLVIDGKRHRAYTHLWEGTTVAIDLEKRSIVSRWPNGCRGSRGIALDEARGYLFVACSEGRASILDVDHDGKELSSCATGNGVDIIDYDPQRGRLYVPAASSATLSIIAVSNEGVLSLLGTVPVAAGSHCATVDGRGRVFVGDPRAGSLRVVSDEFEITAR